MAETRPFNVHATCIALDVEGDWRGVLLRGPSGAGKSDLAIRLVDAGARLVADDRIDLMVESGRVMARPPAVLAGLIEARGVGVLRLPSRSLLAAVPVVLLVDLVPAEEVERLPDPQVEIVLGVTVPLVRLVAFEASTAAKIRLALGATRAS
jgi:serine kinase of HPr protein (carbohydrate metabolism regulator)